MANVSVYNDLDDFSFEINISKEEKATISI